MATNDITPNPKIPREAAGLDPRLVRALRRAPGGRLHIPSEDLDLFEPWNCPWQGVPATRAPDGGLIVDRKDCLPPPRRRRASFRRLVAEAAKAGKSIESVTLPDGTIVRFGEPVSAEAGNPWLADLKVVKR